VAVVADPVLAIPAQRPAQPLGHAIIDFLRRQENLQPDRPERPSATHLAEAEVDPGEEVAVLREEVRLRQFEHLACSHQP
jgi:hypothetical protein